MKVTLMSDLHLEFGEISISNSDDTDILILAGDIIPSAALVESDALKRRAKKFFDSVCGQWDYVLMVCGNHEHYMGDIETSTNILNEFVEHDNFILLEDELFELGGWSFIGATLWTSMNERDPLTEFHVSRNMNDYRAILRGGERLLVEHTIDAHQRSVEYIKLISESHSNVVVITHHSPSFMSVHPKYRNDFLMNGAFHSNLDYIMECRDSIKYWFHGHIHDNMDYILYDTRVVCNPRGYIGGEIQADIFKPKTIILEK